MRLAQLIVFQFHYFVITTALFQTGRDCALNRVLIPR